MQKKKTKNVPPRSPWSRVPKAESVQIALGHETINSDEAMFAAVLLLLEMVAAASAAATDGGVVSFVSAVDATSVASSQRTELEHSWTRCIGSGHAYLGLRDDWKLGLKTVRDELGVEMVRFHAVLDDDIFQLSRDEITKALVFNFTLVDAVYDYITSLGMKPFVEISFMPTVLASGNATWMRYKANVTPPNDIAEWSFVIEHFAAHLMERYGEAEVSSWYFEVWNEPNAESLLNFGTGFFAGNQSQYFELYNATTTAIKSVSKSFRVGGPASAGGGWLDDFLQYALDEAVYADFVSTHHYPSTENPDSISGDVARDMATVRNVYPSMPYLLTEFNSGL